MYLVWPSRVDHRFRRNWHRRCLRYYSLKILSCSNNWDIVGDNAVAVVIEIVVWSDRILVDDPVVSSVSLRFESSCKNDRCRASIVQYTIERHNRYLDDVEDRYTDIQQRSVGCDQNSVPTASGRSHWHRFYSPMTEYSMCRMEELE